MGAPNPISGEEPQLYELIICSTFIVDFVTFVTKSTYWMNCSDSESPFPKLAS